MAINFTPEQTQVIELHHENILVSAAAGSGKTAVLVERIIRMISDEAHPIDIDRLLIVTFTNAAATEMRERISLAIADQLLAHPENEHLQRQSALIHNAQITTIDSFCLFVIRNNFQEIGLDPGFRVADEGEVKLLMQDMLAELLEEKFAQEDEAFLQLVECYSTGKTEAVLEDTIFSLYRFAMSYPWPIQWLSMHKQDYQITTPEQLMESSFLVFLLSYIQKVVPDMVLQLKRCIAICEEPDGPYMYGENLDATLKQLESALGEKDYESYRTILSAVGFERLPSKKDASVNADKREIVKQMRDGVKKQISGIVEQFFQFSEEALLEQCSKTSPVVEALLQLTIEFVEKLDAKKREQNIIDFSDMEHLALNILCKHEISEEGLVMTPSAAALDYRAYFEEIMIDEYQDSNLVQESILQCISREDDGEYNRFMVGDVKQSIYKFRLARPELFMEKFHSYSTTAGPFRRIDLHKNFRSRKQVIEGVNAVFEQLMQDDLGGITYDKDSCLYLGASYPENPIEEDNQTELLIIEKEHESEDSSQALEAKAIGRRIQRMMRSTKVTDKKTGELRPLELGDIVILLRSGAGLDDVIKAELEKMDIPCFISSKTGYFSTKEVSLVLQVLRILDNPLQDIPFFGVLNSYFGQFHETEIAAIKAYAKSTGFGKEKLYTSVKRYAGLLDKQDKQEDVILQEKCQRFLSWFQNLRSTTSYLSISELLQKLMEESHYVEYLTALPAGAQRKANAFMLLEKAAAFEQTSYKGLYHFIRYIEKLAKYNVDYGEASTSDESAGLVRIMTIHKSKGLEFPICFVSGMGKRINRRDTQKAVLTDVDLGLGVDLVDPVLRTKQKTLRKNILAKKIQLDNQAEELRVLYVALTRAKEKLIITGVMNKAEEKLQGYEAVKSRSEKALPYDMRAGAATFLDFLMPVMTMPRIMTEKDLDTAEIQEEIEVVNDGLAFIKGLESGDKNKNMQENLHKIFTYSYPHENLQKLYTKTTVSELKIAAMEDHLLSLDPEVQQAETVHFDTQEKTAYLPKFLRTEEKISGSTRGSAMHRFMELLDLSREYTSDEIKEQILSFVQNGTLTQEYADALRIERIEQFMHSDLALRMRKAQKLYKEQPFVLGISANRLHPEFPETETVLIQGIIDLFFIEENQIILMDYKTDVVKTESELMERYRVQLDYYAEALEKILGRRVAEKIIYSFYLGKEISLL